MVEEIDYVNRQDAVLLLFFLIGVLFLVYFFTINNGC